MSVGDKTQSIWPSFYLFEDKDGWHKSNEALTKDINYHIFCGRPFDCAGKTFFPQWPEPELKSQTRQAWRLDADGEIKARWYWKEIDHQRWHHKCELTDKGRCRIQKPLKMRWDGDRKLWIKLEDPDITT